MTDKTQPEALRLADELAQRWGENMACPELEAAAELRRLHAENARLSGLCDKWNSECDEFREDNKRLAALVEAQQHTRIAELEAELEALKVRSYAYNSGWKDGYKQGAWATQQPSPTPPAEQQAATKAATVKACVCGEYQAPGTVHRVDGPCYVAAPQQEPAPLSDAVEHYLESQDALDNREYAGINAESYETLIRRRNASRKDLDAALAAQGSK